MGHTGNINFDHNLNMGSNMGIGANSNYGVAGGRASEAESKSGVSDVGFAFSRGEKPGRLGNTTMENFQEYMRDKQEQAKEEGIDAETKEREAKEQAKEVSRSISSEELKALEMMGIDVSTANMTDLMGMVNTLRFNADSQQTKELMAKIAVDKGDVENLSMIGGGVSVAGGTEVSSVSVSDVLVAEAKNQQAELQKVDENQPQSQAVSLDAGVKQIIMSDTEAVYLIKNNMSLSKENIYKARYSGMKLGNEVSSSILEDMKPQLMKVIEQAGLIVDGDTLDATKLLINNDIPVTTDNLRKYMSMKEYEGQSIEETDIPEKAVAMDEATVNIKAIKLYEDVQSINPKQVYDMVAQGKTVTIAAAVKYAETGAANGAKQNSNDQSGEKLLDYDMSQLTDSKAVTAMRQMEELRLSMTSAMAGKLIKLDMNVDTRELSKVVSMLKDVEHQLAKDAFYAAGVEPTEDKLNLYSEINTKVNAIGKAPAQIIAGPLMGDTFTIDGLHSRIKPAMEVADAGDTALRVETARRSYEVVGTAPRRDMGDSISKAFANVPDILQEMDMPVNYETERAVRILGYNQLEITEDNIRQVMDYDRQVNDMINTFYPEAVLGMIKDGINPLDVPINELNKLIRDRNYNQGVTEAKNFAAYLRDMEKQGELTLEERESYIGMYRVMEKLSRSGDREAGYLFANGSRLTVRNLITAMRSRKAAGVDVGVDDSFGMLQEVSSKGKRMDAQIEGAFLVAAADESESQASMDMLRQSIDDLTGAIEQFMEANSIDINAINVQAVRVITTQPAGVYGLVSELLGKMKFNTNTKAELIDEETENMADSMMGEAVPIDIGELAMDSILESLRGSEDMSFKYNDLRNKLTELMYQWGAAGTLSQMDIATIKTANAGFNIMSTMARQDRFQIPVDTAQGTKVMNLTIKKDGSNPGLVEVSMSTERYGSITAQVKITNEGNLVGQLVSDSSDGNFSLQQVGAVLKDSLAAAGYYSEELAVGSVSEVDLASVAGLSSEKLYQVSVDLVRSLVGIM